MRLCEGTVNQTKEIALKRPWEALSGLVQGQQGGQFGWDRMSELESVRRLGQRWKGRETDFVGSG